MKRLIWYIRRLSCMSVQEVAYRMYKLIQLNLHILVNTKVDLGRVLADARNKTNFYFDPNRILEIRREFSRLFPNRIKHILTDADKIYRHKFKIFDSEWNPGKEIDWHRNRHNLKDTRFIWELNRFQHLVTLGKAYILTGQKRYAIEARNQVLSWIRQNPGYKGVNWKSPLEVSLRLISWCWTYKLVKSSGVFSISSNKEFLESIYRHAEFVRNNLSRYSSGNNHLIGEGAGLLIAGITFPGFKAAGKWLDTGKKVLFKEILDQVHPDGVTKEQAIGYQGFVMELFLVAAALLEKNDIKVPSESLERFCGMAEFVMNIIDANGNVPNIGDSDNGAAIRLSSARDYSMYRSLLSSAAILSGRGDFKEKGNGFKEEHYWLFGMDGLKRYRRIKKVRPGLDSRLFDKGGYAVFRNPLPNGNVLIMDCGELGYGTIAAHGHADLLSITLSSNGTPLLIDPGTYLYHSGNSWRDYFRGTSAHNTVTVNDKNQSEITGPFMWGRRVAPRIEKWETRANRDYISASYTNCNVTHRRKISFYKKKGLWQVIDSLDSKGKNRVSQYFHLSSGSAVRDLGKNIVESKNRNVYLYIFADRAFSTDVRDDWSSSVFGSKVKSPTLVNSAAVNGRSEFVTFLYISNKKMRLDQLEAIRNEAQDS